MKSTTAALILALGLGFQSSPDRARGAVVDQLFRYISTKARDFPTHSVKAKYGNGWVSHSYPPSEEFRKIANQVEMRFAGTKDLESLELEYLRRVENEPNRADYVFALACAWGL